MKNYMKLRHQTMVPSVNCPQFSMFGRCLLLVMIFQVYGQEEPRTMIERKCGEHVDVQSTLATMSQTLTDIEAKSDPSNRLIVQMLADLLGQQPNYMIDISKQIASFDDKHEIRNKDIIRKMEEQQENNHLLRRRFDMLEKKVDEMRTTLDIIEAQGNATKKNTKIVEGMLKTIKNLTQQTSEELHSFIKSQNNQMALPQTDSPVSTAQDYVSDYYDYTGEPGSNMDTSSGPTGSEILTESPVNTTQDYVSDYYDYTGEPSSNTNTTTGPTGSEILTDSPVSTAQDYVSDYYDYTGEPGSNTDTTTGPTGSELLTAQCLESEVFFKSPWSSQSQCVKVFRDDLRTWDAAAAHCVSQNMELVMPLDPLALMKYLNDKYGGGLYWLGGRGSDDGVFRWERNGVEISMDDPHWWDGRPVNVDNTRCLRLSTWDSDVAAGTPYWDGPCSWTGYHICERVGV